MGLKELFLNEEDVRELEAERSTAESLLVSVDTPSTESFERARPKGALVAESTPQSIHHSPRNTDFSPITKIIFLLIPILALSAYYWYKETQAGTTVNTTIATNDDLESGLVLHYTFDGTDMNWGSTTAEILDSSASSINGNASNTDTGAAVGGKIGQGFNFDGSNDYVGLHSDIDLTGTFTIGLWFNDPTPSANEMFIGEKDASAGGGPKIGRDANAFIFRIVSSIDNFSISVPTKGQWHYLVITRDASNKVDVSVNGGPLTRLYSDVAQVGTYSVRNIGACGLTGCYYSGKMDDVRIYNRILSISEVQRLYELGTITHINTTIDTNDDLENGLVGHWTFDGPKMNWASTTAEVLDSSASSIEGDMVNMNQQSATAGKIGQGLRFDGTNDYVTVDGPAGTTTSATFVAWLKRSTSRDWDGIIYGRDGNPGNDAYGMSAGGSGGTRLSYNWNDDASAYGWNSGLVIPLDEWVMTVIVVEPTQATAYLGKNGSIQSSVNIHTHSGASLSAFSIGRDPDAANRYFSGVIDDVRIYNRALSATEIERLYELGASR